MRFKEVIGTVVNTNKLKGKIVEKGLNVTEVARAIEIDPSTLYRKLANADTISIGEADAIRRVLALSPDEAAAIFFNSDVA